MLHRRTLENYQDVLRSWVILDIDDLPLPEGILPTSQDAAAYAVSKLPACFHDRDYVYHFSSSAGLGGQVFKGHLAFMLTEPVGSNQLHRWARDYVNPDPELVNIDAALFNAVQVHYLADPTFDDPSMDLFAWGSRIGLVTGTQRAVPVSTIIDPPIPVVPAPMPSKVLVRNRHRSSVESSWRTGLDEIGDDRMGLHAGIVHAIKGAVQECGVEVDRGAVKKAIRDRVIAACAAGELVRDQS